MNVLLINGSPHKDGCTNAALVEMAKTLNEAGIETTIFHIGSAPVGGCVGCGGCGKTGSCVFGGPVAAVVEKADGIVFGAPVHYATAAASMLGFMHRLAISGGRYLRHKPAAVVTSARRAGTTTALEAMEKVPQFFEMPLISSTYWPMVHRRCGGYADHAQSGPQHGVDPALHRIRQGCRDRGTCCRKRQADEFYPLTRALRAAKRRSHCGSAALVFFRGSYARLLVRPPLTSSSVTALTEVSACWADCGAWPVGQTFCSSVRIGS